MCSKHSQKYKNNFRKVYAYNWAHLGCWKNPPTHFEKFSHVIVLSNPNFDISREIDLNFDAIEFVVPENP